MSMGIGGHAVVQLPDFTGKTCDYLWAASIIHLERRKLLVLDMAELEPQIAGTKRASANSQ